MASRRRSSVSVVRGPVVPFIAPILCRIGPRRGANRLDRLPPADAKNLEERTRYEPAEVEARIFAEWMDGGYFHPDPQAPGEPFSVAIPPPNVTGVLHMGHALNNSMQDTM